MSSNYVYKGRVVSIVESEFLTEKYGNEKNIGFTVHILIDKINGNPWATYCFELQCYGEWIDKEKEIIKLIQPLYENEGVVLASNNVMTKGSIVVLRGETLRRKRKNGKDYAMSEGTPFCVIKKPLITEIYLPEELIVNSNIIEPKGLIEVDLEMLLVNPCVG
jgi:hypothetical protein